MVTDLSKKQTSYKKRPKELKENIKRTKVKDQKDQRKRPKGPKEKTKRTKVRPKRPKIFLIFGSSFVFKSRADSTQRSLKGIGEFICLERTFFVLSKIIFVVDPFLAILYTYTYRHIQTICSVI